MIEFHPLADLFPMIEGRAFDELVDDVRTNSLRERIVILDGQILDGRNRYRAGVAAGVLAETLPADDDPQWLSHFRRYLPQQDGDPLHWVLSKNLHRRHLTDSQRAMVAARLANMRQGERTDLATTNSDEPSANLPKVSNHDAAERTRVSERLVRTAKSVVDHGAPELVERVERGELSASAAETIAHLPVTEQIRLLRERDPRAFKSVVREERARQQSEKRTKRAEREQTLAARQQALPEKTYGVILEDPEWQFAPYSRDSGMDRAADNHYPTSPTEQIAARPVDGIAADDCVLLLWATAPMLPDALAVMAARGFTYKSHAVWHKDRVGTGYWFRNAHELLLVGTRGSVPAPAMGEQIVSVQAAPVGRHSEKPAFAHELAERHWPNLSKIELNARVPRPGWDAWGLEAPVESATDTGQSETSVAADLGEGATSPSSPDSAPAIPQITDMPVPQTMREAEPLLRARYDGTNAATLAVELGRPVGTVRAWVYRLGLTERARLAGNAHRLPTHREETAP